MRHQRFEISALCGVQNAHPAITEVADEKSVFGRIGKILSYEIN